MPMTKQREVICDIETDGLLNTVTQVWCIVCKDYNTGEIFKWTPSNLDKFEAFADTVHHWIGHNFIGYDMRVLKKLMGIKIKASRVTDTLLVSRLQQYTREGGHSLNNWGRILQFPKLPFKDFDEYTPEMLDYCVNDVELTYKVACYLKLEGKEFGSVEASKIEHLSQHILEEQKELGFALDVPKAHQLFAMLKDKERQLDSIIKKVTPDKPISGGTISPKIKKDGTISKVGLKFLYNDWTNVAGVFTRIDWQEFNLKSPKQKVSRLKGYWKPTYRTQSYKDLYAKRKVGEITKELFYEREQYMWKLSEDNLNTIFDSAPPELKLLGEYAMVSSRTKEVEGWLDALGSDDRVHGTCFSTGAVTHRMSHNKPNMANIPGSNSPYGDDCRSCFTVGDTNSHILLGCDASGVQLRILAHYMNDKDYTQEVVNGDIHTKNLEAMGIDKGVWDDEHRVWSGRSVAKTFIYAWLLGAGDEKVGQIIGGSSSDGRRVKETFLDNLPALASLKQDASRTARLGRLVGLDKRKIEIKSEHFALSCYLQGAESCIMKYAMLLWHSWVKKRGLDARQVAVVHDEFQIEVLKDQAELVGELVKKSIVMSGEHFNLNCPLDAEYRTGSTWVDTH